MNRGRRGWGKGRGGEEKKERCVYGEVGGEAELLLSYLATRRHTVSSHTKLDYIW